MFFFKVSGICREADKHCIFSHARCCFLVSCGWGFLRDGDCVFFGFFLNPVFSAIASVFIQLRKMLIMSW